MTLNEKRIKILDMRLAQLNNFLIKEVMDPTIEQSFADFLKAQGISKDRFIKDLPPEYHGAPSHGVENIRAYAELLNNHKLYLMMQEGLLDDTLPADGGENYGCNGCTDCPCSKGKKGFFNAIGDCGVPPICSETKVITTTERKCVKILGKEVCSNVPVVKVVPNQDCIDKKAKYNACKAGMQESGENCGIMPLPPPVPEVSATKLLWDNYRKKKEAWDTCRGIKKDSGQDLAQHLLHLSNPSEATGRAAFLRLIEYNIFGLASTFDRMRQDPNQDYWKKVKAKYYNLGGDTGRLDQNVSIGKNKKPIFKPKGWKPKGGTYGADGVFYGADGGVWFNAEGWTAAGIAGLIVAATGMLATMAPMIKGFKKDKGDKDDFNYEGSEDRNYPGDPDTPTVDPPAADLSPGIKTALKVTIGLSLAALLGYGIYKAVK